MIRNIAILFAVLILSGCASTKNIPMQDDAFVDNAPSSITSSSRVKPDFSAMTAGKGAFALIGALASISAGNELIEQNQVDDPAVYISQSLTDSLKKQFSLKTISNNDTLIDSDQPSVIAKHYPSSDLVLDVQTINWSFIYFPTDWDNYRVIYTAKLQLIDTRNKSMIAEGFCKRIPEEDENAPSYKDLTSNQAQGLKNELQLAAEHCIEEFSTKVLKIKPATIQALNT